MEEMMKCRIKINGLAIAAQLDRKMRAMLELSDSLQEIGEELSIWSEVAASSLGEDWIDERQMYTLSMFYYSKGGVNV
jgi:hypothetical protein